MNLKFSKIVITGLLLPFLLAAIGFQPVYAVDKSRVFICLLFLSGLGSSAAGAIIEDQANETYDEYMHTAIEIEMEKLIDDYDQKHQKSIIASRVGLGLVVGAALLSLVDAAYILTPEVQVVAAPSGPEFSDVGNHIAGMQAENGDVILTIRGRF